MSSPAQCHPGQTRQFQAFSGVTVRPSYCAAVSFLSCCTNEPYEYVLPCKSPIRQKRPNFRIPYFRPIHIPSLHSAVRDACSPHFPSPLAQPDK